MHGEGKMALRGGQQQVMTSADHGVTDGTKSKGLLPAVLASAGCMNDTPRNMKKLPFPISQA